MLAKALQSAAKAVEPVFIEDVFSTYLYTGNGSTQTITNGIDLAGKGGLVWTKDRQVTSNHWLQDTIRGTNSQLSSSLTNAAASATNQIQSFSSTGYTQGSSSAVNNSGVPFVSWTFRKQAKFYDQQQISHTNGTATNIDLSVLGTVGYLHAKITNTTGDWIAWHRSLTAGNNLRLNITAAQTTTNAWLSVSGTTATLSGSAPTGTYIIHAFAHDAGGFGLSGTDNVISCGSYVGTGAANNTINLGWEPQWLLVKNVTTDRDWFMMDNMRGFSDGSSTYFNANLSNAEAAVSTYWGVTSTGFRVINTLNSDANALSNTYIYIAIRRGPMRVPTDGTKVYNAIARTGTGSETNFTGAGFTPDYAIIRNRTVEDWVVADRLRGGAPFLATNGGGAEQTAGTYLGSATFSSTMDGIRVVTAGAVNAASNSYINYLFRRAPGFFDEVCYTGTGAAATFAHNLGVAPELMIFKKRGAGTFSWYVYAQPLGANNFLVLNGTNAATASNAFITNTAPTSTVFTVDSSGGNSNNATGETYVAYLFATCPGVSKVGSYTGNGSSQTINCGFAAGARFVMIKATSTTGDWLVADSARGIVAGNDPYLELNTTNAEVTGEDWLDTASSGFVVNEVTGSNANTNGVSYIYLAIA